jgi:prepilin-type N-terminal cleavage/methylation domain-containing protein
MSRISQSRSRRSAFTLIELLVVIAIIATLVSLLLAGIFRAYLVVKDVSARNDVSQLGSAIAKFNDVFQTSYIPSKLVAGDGGPSDAWLATAFPNAPAGYFAGLNLEGDQVLVWALGGLQQGGVCVGFSSSPTAPLTAPYAGEVRKGPFFNFNPTRLYTRRAGGASYKDAYGQQPYVFFSCNGPTNGYNAGDCSVGPAPYQLPSGGYLKPDSFQILCAGRNGLWGTSGVWNPPWAQNSAGFDDIANFAQSPLGSANQ